MDRRTIVRAIGAGIAVAAFVARAQMARKVWRIGYLTPSGIPTQMLSTALRELGYVEGQTVRFEVRSAQNEVTFARLRQLREEVTDRKVDEHGGRLIKTTGDGFLAEFASATAALRCAIDLQRDVVAREAERSDDTRIRLRIGINVGNIIVHGDDVAGDGVNIATRSRGRAAAHRL